MNTSSQRSPRIPVVADDQLGPPDVVAAIRQRRGGDLLNVEGLRDMTAAIENHALFTATERATLALTQAMTEQVQVSESCFAALKQVLPKPQHQVELVGVIAAYNMVARFLEALQVAAES